MLAGCVACGMPFQASSVRQRTCSLCAAACAICGASPTKANGLCGAHHMRWLRAGKPGIPAFIEAVRAGGTIGRVLHTCTECGRDFAPHSAQATCSAECATERRRRRQREAKRAEWRRRREELRSRQRARYAAHADEMRARDRARRQPKEQRPKVCRRCGATFLPARHDQRFCSADCQPPPQVCQHCGRDFPGRRGQLYCGKKCRGEAMRERARKRRRESPGVDLSMVGLALAADRPAGAYLCECWACGAEFRSRRPDTRFCSPACRRAEHARRRRKGRRELPPVACVMCGREFVPRRKKAKTCSPECRRKYAVRTECERAKRPEVKERAKLLERARNRTTARCRVCGRDMTNYPDLITNRYTCSAECRREAMRRKNRRAYVQRTQRAAGH